MNTTNLNAGVIFLAILLTACFSRAAEPVPVELISLADTELQTKLSLGSAKAWRTETNGLRLGLHPAGKGSWVGFSQKKLGFPGDWSSHAFLVLELTNPKETSQEIGVNLNSPKRQKRGVARLAPNSTTRVLIPTGGIQEIVGLRGQPPHPMIRDTDEVVSLKGWNFDPTDVRSFAITSSDKSVTVGLEKATLTGQVSVKHEKFVDRFGQYNGADWPGKLHEETDLAARRETEAEDWAQHPRSPGLNRWGGWADGPQLEATGRFRAAKHEGKWWLVDPDGRLFWSSGLDCVRLASRTSQVNGRKNLFAWLPKEDDPLAQFYSKGNRFFDFFGANLSRKYGEEYGQAFYETAAARFQSWGINTLGNWSDYREMARLEKLAYTAALRYQAERFVARDFVVAGKRKMKWFPDPFHPEFVPGLVAGMNEQLGELRDDPWLLGVFIDNELDWGHRGNRISATVLANETKLPVKQALLSNLRERFDGVEAFNRELGTRFTGWSDLEKPVELNSDQKKKGEKVFADFDAVIAEKYFAGCREAMRQALPGVLYLGPRFHGNCSEEVIRVAARYCDVVSFNIYEELPEDRNADELARELDFPAMIGEWHFGATDRGMFHTGLVAARDQEDRAAKYAAYTRSAIKADWCVGAHWFQYIDQQLTGRFDGENYAIGFIDVTDDPYPEMVAAARKVYGEMYRLRAGNDE